MTESLYLVVGDDTYQVHEIADTRRWTRGAGLGMPPVRHITQRGVRQDGETLLDVRLQPRVIDVGFWNTAADREAYWEARRALFEYLKVFDGSLKLSLVIDDTSESFDLDVVYDSGAELDNDMDWGLKTFTAGMRFVAHNPVWYATDPTVVTIGLPTSGDGAYFPWAFGLFFGSTSVDNVNAITYAGSWKAYPQIDLVGPLENPTITNEATGEVLALTMTIDEGDVVRFDLDPLQKTVRNITDDTNEIDHLSESSDLATWHLAPDPEVAGGINTITVAGYDAASGSTITLRWHDQYIGL